MPKKWNTEELRGFLFHILGQRPSTEAAVEKIIAFILRYEVPRGPALVANENPNKGENLGKSLVMNRFLTNNPKEAFIDSLDSTFESGQELHSIREPNSPLPPFNSQRDAEMPTNGRIRTAKLDSGIPGEMSAVPPAESLQPVDGPSNGKHASLSISTGSPELISANDENPSGTSSGGEILELVLGKKKAERIASNMTTLFETLIEHHCGVRTRNGGTVPNRKGPQENVSAPSQSALQPRGSQDGGDSQQGGPEKKPRDRDDDGDDDNDDTSRGKKRLKANAVYKQKLACPFMKRHPMEFSTWRTCPGPGFDGLNRMKEHLKRKHLKEHECQRCGSSFENARALQSHLREIEPCSVDTATQKMGLITQVQWDEIGRTRKSSGVSEQDMWRQIYGILFPEVDPWAIPSPCGFRVPFYIHDTLLILP
ncbi:hypothetical protein B0I35DRAFT_183231 [Stachybotrys elegans]|uniref:C2H2-type domain-containing protein n=1 Tax=Stachybotrys elegans TaxID=80388 RepID=A0A8K0STX6_9HYPO|nr:hypothetical protein B0I35DRAFT_183231 [Stachybotrys elegans]